GSAEQVPTGQVAEASGTEPAPERKRGRRLQRRWLGLIGLVILLDVIAFVAFPQVPRGAAPGTECSFPACFIENSLEFPAPHSVITLDPQAAPPPPVGVYLQP